MTIFYCFQEFCKSLSLYLLSLLIVSREWFLGGRSNEDTDDRIRSLLFILPVFYDFLFTNTLVYEMGRPNIRVRQKQSGIFLHHRFMGC